MNLSLKGKKLDWARSRVQSGEFASLDEYVAALIEHDRENEARLERLREAVAHGRESGLSERSLQDIHEGFLKRCDAA